MVTRALDNEYLQDASRFDYQSVSPSVANFLRGQAERIRRGCTTSIIHAGKALIEAKRHLSHGGFVRWVQSEVGLPVRTAQAYMQVAQWVKGKSAAVSQLPPSILYILSSRSTPGEFTAKLLERHEAGEEIDARGARAELRAMRTANGKTTSLKIETPSFAELPALRVRDVQCNTESSAMMAKAVDILISRLSSFEFEEVKDIMTSRFVLDDPNLARNIAAAFLLADRSVDSHRLRDEAPRHLEHERYSVERYPAA